MIRDFCTTFIYGYVTRGYGWIFPAGEKVFIGIGSRDSIEVKNAFKSMLKDLDIDYSKKKFRGAWIPCFEKKDSVCGKIIYTGDSLALTSPLFGEGIYNALYSGRLAVECILKGNTAVNYKKDINKNIVYTNRFEMIITYFFL